MDSTHSSKSRYLFSGMAVVVIALLYFAQNYHYLLFHILLESFSIMVAVAVFLITWHAREYINNNYLLLVGIAYLFIGGLDFVHTLAYEGMELFAGYDAGLAPQLWIATRYLEAVTLLVAPWFLARREKLPAEELFLLYTGISVVILVWIFSGAFPLCYVEGQGLTPFKKVSEYLISLLLLASFVHLRSHRDRFDPAIYRLLAWAIFITIGAELAFTFYVSMYGLSNLVGHYLKVASFFLIYRAVIQLGLEKPYSLLFRELKQGERRLQAALHELEGANAQLRQAVRLREDVERITRHDLKSPLNAILGFPQVIRMEKNLTPVQEESLHEIERAGRVMLDMINRSLDLFKMEQGLYTVNKVEVDLVKVADSVVKDISALAAAEEVSITVLVNQRPAGTEEAFIVPGEELLLYSMLGNLVRNAVEATPPGGEVQVAMAGLGPDRQAEITVRNPGEVPHQIRERVF